MTKKITALYSLLIVFSLLFGNNFAVFGQKVTISGYLEDSSSGERLIGGIVYDTLSKIGTTTNNYGYFSLTFPSSKLVVRFSYVGFETLELPISIKKDTIFQIGLKKSAQLNEVVVTGKKESQVKQSQMSEIEIPLQTIQTLPMFLGERDLFKAIQLFPGVHSGGEGTSGLYVRGGGPDQNLILLDGVPVYNADHLFGFFSVFNPDAINHVSLIKGGFPARYGGRLSSVLDIRMKEGNNKSYHGDVTVGLIASKITIEGPIIKNKASFIISARRTYIDILAQPFILWYNKQNSSDGGTTGGYYFYDMNAKFNYTISPKDRVYLSFYGGQDRAYVKSEYSYTYDQIKYENNDNFGLDWGNIITALRWNHIYNKQWFSNVSLTYSKFQFGIGLETEYIETENNTVYEFSDKLGYLSGIEDWSFKADFEYHPDPKHQILMGVSDIYHTFIPGKASYYAKDPYTPSPIDLTLGNKKVYTHEISMYIEDEFTVNSKLKLDGGLHFSMFPVDGKFYSSLQPRLNGRYIFAENWSIKGAVSKMTQYIVLLSNSGIGLPTDLWLPVTKNIKPQDSWQFAAGIFHDLKYNIEVGIEGYYKTMTNLIEYKEGSSFMTASISESWETEVESGTGNAYGMEVLIRKNEGKFTGWIGYTLSWTNRLFENLNFGKQFPYKYDRRHDVGLAANYKFNDRIDVGLVWVYGSGNALNLPIERYLGYSEMYTNLNPWMQPIQYYKERNGFRMPSYHRMDLGINFHKKKKYGERIWSINIYNVYNRQNPFMITFEEGIDNNGNQITRLKQISLFPIIPSFSYTYKF
jgi:outer membrane receptor for ferrienterochelin and colicin